MPTVPPHNCVKPELPGANANNARMRQFNDSYKAYGECIRKYIEGAKALADSALDGRNADWSALVTDPSPGAASMIPAATTTQPSTTSQGRRVTARPIAPNIRTSVSVTSCHKAQCVIRPDVTR